MARRWVIAIVSSLLVACGAIYYYCRWSNYRSRPLFCNLYAANPYSKTGIGLFWHWWPWPDPISDGRSRLALTDLRSNMIAVVRASTEEYRMGWGVTHEGLDAVRTSAGHNDVLITRQPDCLVDVDDSGARVVRRLNPGEAKSIDARLRAAMYSGMSRSQRLALVSQIDALVGATSRPSETQSQPQEEQDDPDTLTAAITGFTFKEGKLGVVLDARPRKHLRMLNGYNSFGPFAYSIEITAPDRRVTLKRKDDYQWNRPMGGYWEYSGKEATLEFLLTRETWIDAEDVEDLKPADITAITIHYQTGKTHEAKNAHIFCGPMKMVWRKDGIPVLNTRGTTMPATRP